MNLHLADLADARVAIWGFGREGRATLAMLRRRFPDKVLTVFCSASEADALKVCDIVSPPTGSGERNILDARLRLITDGPDAEALSQFDIVIKSPGISPYKLPAAAALRAGVRFTSGTALWFAEHPHARTICITGTKGKSTVTALIAHLLRKGGQRIALAGNIGLPLLALNAPAPAPDWWVIELSSFQTHDFGGVPSVAVINNLYEEHLDWHGTRERYFADKLAIATHAQRLVVNAQETLLRATHVHPARSVFGNSEGWHVAGAAIRHGAIDVLPLSCLPMPGLHNAQNMCAALAAIDAAGFDSASLAAHVASFQPLPHRLQRLGERDGIDYVNDSIATTPYATIEALRSLGERPVTVLVGGFDRGVDWQPFVRHVAAHAPAMIVTMGANGDAIAAALRQVETPDFALVSAGSLDAALVLARSHTLAGGTILLSPGAPSFDRFRDYAERGREFARLAGFDPAAITQIDGIGIV
ncbi:MAG TPA: UDP-N-acetylmuramoyl-L-alanine--D-glutamate ligase [Rudaea sp.]|jgi:UDP-N-acetylmuramoylalanine--D-glutamate ligase